MPFGETRKSSGGVYLDDRAKSARSPGQFICQVNKLLAQLTLCGKVADDTASYAFQVLTREKAPMHWHFCRECRRYRGEDACE